METFYLLKKKQLFTSVPWLEEPAFIHKLLRIVKCRTNSNITFGPFLEGDQTYLLSQLGPPHPNGQSHETLFAIIEQVPPFWQGLGWQERTGTSHVVPVQLAVHVHSNVEPTTEHDPEFKQGFGSHGFEDVPNNISYKKIFQWLFWLRALLI